jgi:tetratricopeptide (TPR) repeat protein
VPRDLLSADPEALPEGLRDAFDRDDAIEALLRFSLLRAVGRGVAVHRLIQAVTGDALAAEQAASRARCAVRLVEAAWPGTAWRNPDLWPAIALLLAHALAASEAAEARAVELEAAGTVLNDAAIYLHARGAYAEAEPLSLRALAISAKAFGPDHPTLAIRLNNLANLYQNTGRYAAAEPLFKRALAIGEKTLGPEHPDLATRLGNLASVYRNTGRLAAAEPLLERAAAIAEKALGPEHPDLAVWFNSLATLYQDTGRYAAAEPLYRRALAIAENVLPANHPTVAVVRRNLAQVLAQRDRANDAAPSDRPGAP